jgi:hypothetical protein
VCVARVSIQMGKRWALPQGGASEEMASLIRHDEDGVSRTTVWSRGNSKCRGTKCWRGDLDMVKDLQ